MDSLRKLVIGQAPGDTRIGRPWLVPSGWVLQLVDRREIGHAWFKHCCCVGLFVLT